MISIAAARPLPKMHQRPKLDPERTPWSGRFVANHRVRFPCIFNAAVGSQSHSPKQYYCYKFRGCWIPVALPPPVLPRPTFSADFERAKKPNNRGLRAQTSALRLGLSDPKLSLPGRLSPNLRTSSIWCGLSKMLILGHFPHRSLCRFRKFMWGCESK